MTKQLINILYVDDNLLDRELVHDVLEQEDGGFQVIEATSRAVFETRLAKGDCDLVLSDFNILGFDGLQVIDAVRTKNSSLPVVIFTGTGSEEVAVEAIKRGAADYIVKKPENFWCLPLTLRAALAQNVHECKQAIDVRRESEEKYQSLIQKIQTAVVLHDGNGRILTSNPMAQRLLGFSEDQLFGKELIDPEWHFLREDGTVMPVSEYPVSLVLTSRQPLRDYVAGIYRPDREEPIWVLVSAEPEFDDTNEIAQIIVSFIDLTGRKRVEEALQEKQELLLEAQRIAHIGNWWHDLITGEIFWSDEFFHIIGREPQKVGTELAPVIIHPDDLPMLFKAMEESAAGKMEYEHEFRIVRPDGEIRWIHNRWVRVNDKDGNEIKRVGTHQDITERKRTEEALRESEARYRLVFENSPVSIWEEDFSGVKAFFDDMKKAGTTNIETYFDEHPEALRQCAELLKIVDVNQAALALHGAANKEELLTGLTQTFTPESFDTFQHELICLWNGEMEMTRDAVVQTLAGEPRHVTIYFSVCPGYEETFSKILVSLIDITKRKQAEEERQNVERHLRTIVENFPDFMTRFDEQCRHLYINPAVEKGLNVQLEQYVGKTLSDLNTPGPSGQNEMLIAAIQQAFKEGSPNLVEAIWPTPKGERIFEVRHIPELNDGGKVVSVVGVTRDITEQRHAEEEIRQLNKELEQRVANRTAQLEAANKELEAFAYSVSHDLRAPLRHIDGFVGLLQRQQNDARDDRSRHYMDNIAYAARHMGQLIDDLLSFSRMGRYELSKRAVDLSELVQEIVLEYEPETQDRDICWEIAALPIVNGDRAMLRLVWANLIANALKFTRKCPLVEIEIGYLPGDKENTIFIRDNGVGFDMAYADKLFGVFQRLHHADEFEGTGIGLANVQRIINRHGGRTWAEGKMNKGATFYFSLPPISQEINSPEEKA